MLEKSTSLFGKVLEPESVDEVLSAIRTPYKKGDDVEYFQSRFWQGQANINWPVDSTAARRLGALSPKVKTVDLLNHEKYMIRKAKHRGFHLIDGRELGEFETMARLRHYGAASALLDVSKNSLIGLWFASTTESEDYGLLCGIHCNYVGGSEGEIPEKSYLEGLADCDKFDHPLLFEPTSVSPRVAAQSSVFLYGKSSNSKRGTMIYEAINQAYLFIAISPELKPEILRVLNEYFSINRLTIFPDIEGFSQSHSPQYEMYYNERW
jgi:FRG domain